MSDTLIELLRTLNKVNKLEKKIITLEKRIESLSKQIEELSKKKDSSEIVELLKQALNKPLKSSNEKKEQDTKSTLRYAAEAAIIHYLKEPPKRGVEFE